MSLRLWGWHRHSPTSEGEVCPTRWMQSRGHPHHLLRERSTQRSPHPQLRDTAWRPPLGVFGARATSYNEKKSCHTRSGHHETSKHVDRIIVESHKKPNYQNLEFRTIRLSCESHQYDPRKEHKYAGFILYGWENDCGEVLEDWHLNGKHCKSAYLVIQGSDSPDVKRYIGPAPGQVHGAVYWNVFGKGSVVSRAVGEGFALVKGEYKWNSVTFNANSDAYHDGRREISALAKKCVKQIEDDWKCICGPCAGKTYYVKKLLGKRWLRNVLCSELLAIAKNTK